MRPSKMFYSLVAASLFAFGNVAHAAVHDFGNVQSATSSNVKLSDADSGIHDNDSEKQFGRDSRKKVAEKSKVKWEGGRSGKYTPVTSPVPEPETYAMILAGLALIGFTARRRNRNT